MQLIRLQNDCQCGQLLRTLGGILSKQNKQILINQYPNETILSMVETQERRQKKLDHFFREAYSRVSDLCFKFDLFSSVINTSENESLKEYTQNWKIDLLISMRRCKYLENNDAIR